MSHIFISYSHYDSDYAHRLADTLQASGFDIWIDARIDYGSQWPLMIQEQLDSCQAFLLIMTPRSFASGWVQSELQRASRKQKTIFPLLLEGEEPWLSVESTQYYDVRGGALPDAKFYSALEKVVPRQQGQAVQLPVDKVKAFQKTNSSARFPKLKTEIVVAVIGAAATLLAGVLPIMWSSLSDRSVPSPTQEPLIQSTFTNTLFVPTQTPSPSATATITRTATLTLTPEPGYSIVDPEEVKEIAPTLRSLGQLAEEKYSEELRNSMDFTLTFTVNSTPDVPILWRWFWCAATERLLEQNLKRMSVLFEADGYLIPEDRLAQVPFINSGEVFAGWPCLTYETVLRDWKPGTYTFIQTIVFESAVNDGRDTFPAGYRTYEYTVHISNEAP